MFPTSTGCHISCADLYRCFFPSSDDAEFLWRLARAARDLSQLPGVEAEQKKQLVFEAFENAKKALEKEDNSFAVHKVRWCFHQAGRFRFISAVQDHFFKKKKPYILPVLTQWYAICLSDVGDYMGVKVKIGNSYIIRDHLEVRKRSDLCQFTLSYL